MQKVVQPDQVDYYLDRGYDRVSGFVHRAGEVAHLQTPGQAGRRARAALPGSPFSTDAAEVHVLRWPAHRPSLYRIPYGGQTEAAMRAMEGWVIERPPFRGNGFAPGDSSEVVAEFKVDSARLPHGAQLWRLVGGRHREADRPARRRPPAVAPGRGGLMRDGYVARWRGQEYEASPDGDDVRLYLPEPQEGFDEVRAGRFRRVVPAGEVQELAYVRTTCSWKGAPFIVLGRARRLAAGGVHGRPAPIAESMALEEFDFGVYQGWAPVHEVTDIREHRV